MEGEGIVSEGNTKRVIISDRFGMFLIVVLLILIILAITYNDIINQFWDELFFYISGKMGYTQYPNDIV